MIWHSIRKYFFTGLYIMAGSIYNYYKVKIDSDPQFI